MQPTEPLNSNFKGDISASFAKLVLMRTIGAKLVRVEPGEVDVALPFRDDLTQQLGYIAAGVVSAILDVACGYAAMSLAPPRTTILTVEFKVNLLAPALGERFVARGHVIRPGRTITVCGGDVVALNETEEELIATMLATMMTIKEG